MLSMGRLVRTVPGGREGLEIMVGKWASRSEQSVPAREASLLLLEGLPAEVAGVIGVSIWC